MKTKTLLLTLLGIVVLGVIGFGRYEKHSNQTEKNPYISFEQPLFAPFDKSHYRITDGGTFTLARSNNEVFSLDMETFQPKRDLGAGQGMDTEDMTVIELKFTNARGLVLRPSMYAPVRDKMIPLGTFGYQMLNVFQDKEGEMVVFLIDENRVNLENFSKLNPAAYVVTLPRHDFFDKDYTQYLFTPTLISPINQDLPLEMETSIYNLTDKLASLENEEIV